MENDWWESISEAIGGKVLESERTLAIKDGGYLTWESPPTILIFSSDSSSPSALKWSGGRLRILAITSSASKSAEILEIRISKEPTAFSPWATKAPNIATSCCTGPLSTSTLETVPVEETSSWFPVEFLSDSLADSSETLGIDLTRFPDPSSSLEKSLLSCVPDLFLPILLWTESYASTMGFFSCKFLNYYYEALEVWIYYCTLLQKYSIYIYLGTNINTTVRNVLIP